MRKMFAVCEHCRDRVAQFKSDMSVNPRSIAMPDIMPLFTITAEFPMCAVCQRYDKTPYSVAFDVAKYSEEECDCEPGRPQHNNGGNYHTTTWQPVRV